MAINKQAYKDEYRHIAEEHANDQWNLPVHRTEAGYPHCSTCDGGGCPDCTDPA